MRALVLEKKKTLQLRNISINEQMSDTDVRVQLKACGICGSDIHYYNNGRIGDFIVTEPMVLGHEAAGVVTEVGKKVTSLKVGDRVCMEPGIPNFTSQESLEGNYNLDVDVRFWATPPIHGVMRESVVHPEALTFRLPDNVSFHEGAMVEPLAVGIEAAKNAHIEPGDVALVVGSGPIGIMTALSALAGGCSKVIISARSDEKLQVASLYDGIIGVNSVKQDLSTVVLSETNNRGVDILFETSGNPTIFPDIIRQCRKGGRVIFIGLPSEVVLFDITLSLILGISTDTVFRYRNCFPRALALISSGKIDVTRLISKVFPFDKSIEAYEYAAAQNQDTVKVMIDF